METAYDYEAGPGGTKIGSIVPLCSEIRSVLLKKGRKDIDCEFARASHDLYGGRVIFTARSDEGNWFSQMLTKEQGLAVFEGDE